MLAALVSGLVLALVVPDRPLGRCQPADADGYIVPCGGVSAVTPERQGVTLDAPHFTARFSLDSCKSDAWKWAGGTSPDCLRNGVVERNAGQLK